MSASQALPSSEYSMERLGAGRAMAVAARPATAIKPRTFFISQSPESANRAFVELRVANESAVVEGARYRFKCQCFSTVHPPMQREEPSKTKQTLQTLGTIAVSTT